MTNTQTNETTAKAASLNDLNIFDPDIENGGLILNLDASIASSIVKTTNGTVIDTWTDQKNGLVATSQANTATYQMDGVKLDGTDHFSIPTFAALNLTTQLSIFVVATVDDVVANTDAGFVSHSSGATGYQFRYAGTPAGNARFTVAGSVDVKAGVTSWESDQRSLIGVVWQGSSSYEYQKNGSQLGLSRIGGGSGNSANIPTLIGAAENGLTRLVGTINQILIYNGKLTGANLTYVGDGLYNKWK